MRIYFARNSDPMITDTVAGLNAIAQRLRQFLRSDEPTTSLKADAAGSPEPYEVLLPGVEFAKTKGPILVELLPERGLRVSGSPENLRTWCSYFSFRENAQNGDHHHPEHLDRPGYIDPRTLSVIIEVEDEG